MTNPDPKTPRKSLLVATLIVSSLFANPDPRTLGRSLLVTTLIISSLLAIAGSLWLNFTSGQQAAKKPGGSYMYKGYVGSMNRAQQAHYLERGRFASSKKQLGLPETNKVKKYIFLPVGFSQAAFNYALPTNAHHRAYVGGVFVTKPSKANEFSTVSILCEAEVTGDREIGPPINAQTCGSGTSRIE